MALIINQGKQDTSNDSKEFQIIVENDVTLQIKNITLNTFKANALNVEFKVISGAHKNRVVFDTVEYDPNSKFSWKYRSLRSCAGAPYQESEPANIDIEKLLVNKVISADLSARPGKDSNGNMKDYQSIKYKKYTKAVKIADSPGTPTPTAKPELAPAKNDVSEDIFQGVPIPDDPDWD